MSTYTKVLDKECVSCKQPMQEISMKSPYIDDYDMGCQNESCKAFRDSLSVLNSRAANNAYREEYYVDTPEDEYDYLDNEEDLDATETE